MAQGRHGRSLDAPQSDLHGHCIDKGSSRRARNDPSDDEARERERKVSMGMDKGDLIMDLLKQINGQLEKIQSDINVLKKESEAQAEHREMQEARWNAT